MNIKNRIIEFIEKSKIPFREFERRSGLANGYVKRFKGKIGVEKLEDILNAFPELNRDWLLTGEGEMLKTSKSESNVNAIEPFVPENLVKVRLLEITPTATFTEFASMPVEEYDYTYVYPVEGEEIGEDDVVFSVRGDSMEPRIQNKSRVLGKLIKKAQWHWAKGIVIIAFDNSFVVKRILDNKLDTDNYLILGSDNSDYPETIKVSLDSINIMYQADRIVYAPIR